MRHGIDLKVNWLGRAGVWPVMGALFFAMAGVDWLAEACLYVGLGTGARVRGAVRSGRASAVSCQTLNVSLSIAMLAAP